MKTKEEIAMKVRKSWDNDSWRWKIWVDAGGFRSEIFCYSTSENEYTTCVRQLVDHAYQMQSI